MKILNKAFNFSDIVSGDLGELGSMTPYDLQQHRQRYWEEYYSRTVFERLVLDLRGDLRRLYLLATVPGFALVIHLPPKAGKWLLDQIASGKWWLIGPEAWWMRTKNAVKNLHKEARP